MWHSGRSKRNKKGLGNVIATIVFVFIAIFLTGNLFVWGILRYADFVDTVDEMERLDLLKERENISLTEVIFGDSASYSSSPVISSLPALATDGLIGNTNFTENTDGWSFTKEFPPGVNFGLSGGLDEGAVGPSAVGSPSGPGVVFVGVNFLPESTPVLFKGIWTNRFFVDLDRFAVPIGNTFDGTITLSWGSNLPSALWNDGVQSAKITVWLENSIAPISTLKVTERTFTSAFDTDTTWNFQYLEHVTNTSGFTPPVPPSFWGLGGDPGQWFSLILETEITMKPTIAPAEVRVYFDDIGLLVKYGPVEFADVEESITLGSEDVGGITGIDVTFASAYFPADVKQVIFIKDFSTDLWTSISENTVSSSTTTLTISIRGADTINFISPTKEIRIRILSISNGLVVFSATTSSLTIQDFFRDTGKVTVLFENTGDITARIVSLWIIDSSGQTNVEAPALNLFIPPGGSGSHTLTHTWAVGQNQIKVFTDRGNVATITVNAG